MMASFKTSLKDFEHNLASMWNEHNCTVVWTFFGINLLRDWIENWLFPVLWSLLSFPNLLTYWVQHWNIGKTDAEAPVLWPLNVKEPTRWKRPHVGKDWKQIEKGMAEDKMVRQHHQLNGREFEQTLGGSKLWRRAEPAVLQFMELKGYGQHLLPEKQQWC